jgi:hypothetical protein
VAVAIPVVVVARMPDREITIMGETTADMDEAAHAVGKIEVGMMEDTAKAAKAVDQWVPQPTFHLLSGTPCLMTSDRPFFRPEPRVVFRQLHLH